MDRVGPMHKACGMLSSRRRISPPSSSPQTMPSSPRIWTASSKRANAARRAMFGYQPAELIGQSVRVLIPPDRQRRKTRSSLDIRNGQRVDHFETVRLTKGRTPDRDLADRLACRVTPQAPSSASRRPHVTSRSESRRLQALAAQQEWFRVTLASIGDGIIASDPQGQVTLYEWHR